MAVVLILAAAAVLVIAVVAARILPVGLRRVTPSVGEAEARAHALPLTRGVLSVSRGRRYRDRLGVDA